MNPVDALERRLSALEPLELRFLPEEGLHFDETVPRAWLVETLALLPKNGLAYEALADGRVTLEVTPLGPVDQRPPIRVRGRVDATVRTECVRCLESVEPPVDAEVDLTLLPAPAAPADPKGGRPAKMNADDARVEDWSGEEFPDPESLGEAMYRGEQVDLPDFLREALLLGLTSHPVCADVPACDLRTAALIDAANAPARAADTALDPRWAALAKLKLEDDDRS